MCQGNINQIILSGVVITLNIIEWISVFRLFINASDIVLYFITAPFDDIFVTDTAFTTVPYFLTIFNEWSFLRQLNSNFFKDLSNLQSKSQHPDLAAPIHSILGPSVCDQCWWSQICRQVPLWNIICNMFMGLKVVPIVACFGTK